MIKRAIVMGGKLKNSLPKPDRYNLFALMREFNRCDQRTLQDLLYMWRIESSLEIFYNTYKLKVIFIKSKTKEQIVEIVQDL
jgi:hypothetical protein